MTPQAAFHASWFGIVLYLVVGIGLLIALSAVLRGLGALVAALLGCSPGRPRRGGFGFLGLVVGCLALAAVCGLLLVWSYLPARHVAVAPEFDVVMHSRSPFLGGDQQWEFVEPRVPSSLVPTTMRLGLVGAVLLCCGCGSGLILMIACKAARPLGSALMRTAWPALKYGAVALPAGLAFGGLTLRSLGDLVDTPVSNARLDTDARAWEAALAPVEPARPAWERWAAIGPTAGYQLALAHAAPQVSGSELPGWTRNPQSTDGESTTYVLHSRLLTERGRAVADVQSAAEALVRQHFHLVYPYKGRWEIPTPVLLSAAVPQRHLQVVERDFGSFQQTMYREFWQVQLTPEVRERLHSLWRLQIVAHRLVTLCGLFALAFACVALPAGYFRLDTLTGGQYRLQLKLALALLFAAVLCAATTWLA